MGGGESDRKGWYRPGRIMREGERREMLVDRQMLVVFQKLKGVP